MSLGLEALAPCFQGLIPATLFTCAADGTPNAAHLSHVEYVDPAHVALSFQFFNKSRRNVAENPNALVRVIDPDTQQGWDLRLRYERSETEGDLFDRMALRIEAIASYCGLKGIFKLRAADIYEVRSVAPVAEEPGLAVSGRRREPSAVFTMQALQDMAARINRAEGLERLLDGILEGLEDIFGFTHAMILLPGERPGLLVTIATRGYPENGVGAEARFGEGITGMVAEARKPIRISGLMRGLLYAYAAHYRAREEGWCPPERRIPMPGLEAPESQLGVPLLVRGELVGVLCIESEIPYRFHEQDKVSIEVLGSYLAIAIQNALLQEASASDAVGDARVTPPASAPVPAPPRTGPAAVVAAHAVAVPPDRSAARAASAAPGAPVPRAGKKASSAARAREVTYYAADECVLVDGEYLIRGLPAKILRKLLLAQGAERRSEFTNRELRLDKSLQLPEYKDNLETRLLLLRRRLDEKCPDIRLVPSARGRFRLELKAPYSFAERP